MNLFAHANKFCLGDLSGRLETDGNLHGFPPFIGIGTMELKGRAIPYLICSHQIKAENSYPHRLPAKNTWKIDGCKTIRLPFGAFFKRLDGLSRITINYFNQAGAWSREVDWDFHQVTKCNKWISEFTTSPKYLGPTLSSIFFYFPRSGTKHPSLVTFTVFSNERFSSSTVRRFMPWKNVQEKSSRRARSATGDCCCGGVFFGCPGSKKDQVPKKRTTPFLNFVLEVGWLVG